MSKGVKTVLGVAAAVAIPFAAPVIAAALPVVAGLGAMGSALVGAGLGAGAGAISGGGRGALLGAAGGGLGGFAGAGGLGNLFGSTGGATGGLFGAGAGAPTALPGAAAATPVGGLLTGATPAGLGAVAPGVAATTAPAAGLATGGVSSTILNLGKQLAGGVSVPGLANLAMTMFNKPQEGLTPAEQAALIETAQLAQTNRNLFNQRVSEAQKLINMGTPNPEQAFAEAQGRVERGYREATRTAALRGVSTPESRLSDERRAAIAGTREGTSAVNRDYERAAKTRQMGVAAMPTDAPTGPAYAGLMFAGLPEKRQQTYQQETSRAVGGLFGPTTSSTAAPTSGGPMTLKSLFA